MHESIMSTGKSEDRAHYQTVCDALNSTDGHRPTYGWHLVDLDDHMLGHTWKMVYRSDKRPTNGTVNGMLSMMHGASIAVKYLKGDNYETRDRSAAAKIQKIIEIRQYRGVLDQDGWETLELTVRNDYPQLADMILKELD